MKIYKKLVSYINMCLFKSIILSILICFCTGYFQVANADTVNKQTEMRLKRMEDQIRALQGRQSLKAESSSEKKSKETKHEKGGFKFLNTTMHIGGFVKLEANYDLNENLGYRPFPFRVKVGEPVNGGHFNLNPRASRLTFQSYTPNTSIGPIRTFVGVDFYGAGGNQVESNSYGLRLRRAFITWGNWLVGQDWNNFADFKYGHVIDFSQPMGENAFPRQAQIRYTRHLSKTNLLAVALENPEGRILTSQGVAGTQGNGVAQTQDKAPDITARYNWTGKSASFQLSGLFRYLTVTEAPGLNGTHNALGWGINTGGTYTIPTGTTFMLQGTYGEGIGRYLSFPVDGAALYVNQSGRLARLKKWGWIATISQKITSKLSANVIYSVVHNGDLSNAYFDASHANKREEKAYLNLFYKVTKQFKLGAEYLHVTRKLQNGDQGDANRISLAAWYYF